MEQYYVNEVNSLDLCYWKGSGAILTNFMSVDPMYMKYPDLTPYHYCGNNPVMRVDPNGEDEYEFTSKGEIKNVKTTDFDSFHKVDKNGNRIEGKSLSFNKKVVSGNIKLKNDNGTSANVTLFQRGYTIREANHNHPSSNNSSSSKDVRIAGIIQKKFPRATFNIYTTIYGYTPYNKNTTTTTTQMPTYELPEIIIKP